VLLRNEAKVGLLIFAAIIVFIAAYWFLRGFGLSSATYPVYAIFSDAHKLDKGADVRMAGVKVGYVSDIGLTKNSQARVDMIIFNGTCVPSNSVARITTGGFIGDNYVDILPGTSHQCIRPHQRLASQEPMNYDKLVENVGTLVTQLQGSVKGLNSVLGDKKTIDSMKATIYNLQMTTSSANDLIKSAQGLVSGSSPTIRKTFANMEEATNNAALASRDLRDIINAEARPNAHAILAQVRETMANLNDAITDTRKLIQSFGGSTGKVDQILTNLNAAAEETNKTMQEADKTMTTLNEAAGGLRDITTDKQLKADLQCTLANTAEATAQAKELVTSLNKRFGEGKKEIPAQKAAIPNPGISADALWIASNGEYRFNANYTFGGGDDLFYRIGAYDIGENTRLNLQQGKMLSPRSDVRYGLYASRIGVGFDHRFSNRLLFSGDLFRPNEPELEVRGILGLTRSLGLYGGADLFNNQALLLGVQYNK